MATQSEIQEAIEERCKMLDGMNVSEAVKKEVASAAMVLECCYVAAKDLEGRMEHTKNVPRGQAGVEGRQERKDIALALFHCLIERSTQAQQGPAISLGDLGLGDVGRPGRN